MEMTGHGPSGRGRSLIELDELENSQENTNFCRNQCKQKPPNQNHNHLHGSRLSTAWHRYARKS